MNLSKTHDDPCFCEHDARHRPHRAIRWRACMRRVLTGMLLVGTAALWAPASRAQDLALTALLQPASGCALTAVEDVEIRMFNHGPTLSAGTTIQFVYVVSGHPAINDSIVLGSDFYSKTSMSFTFAAPADLAAPGDYHFLVALNLAGDINTGNNSINDTLVVSTAASVAGTISGPATGSSGALTVTGNVGSVVQWEESPDAQRWFKLGNESTSQSFSALTEPTHFRVRVANAPCAAATSNAVTVTP